jgi:hypothetical protein
MYNQMAAGGLALWAVGTPGGSERKTRLRAREFPEVGLR